MATSTLRPQEYSEKNREMEPSTATSSEETLQDSAANSTSTPPGDPEKAGEPSGAVDTSYEVAFTGLDDPDNPKSFSTARKWLITVVVACCSLCVTTNSTIYTFTYDQIIPEFGTTREVATIGLTSFVIGLGKFDITREGYFVSTRHSFMRVLEKHLLAHNIAERLTSLRPRPINTCPTQRILRKENHILVRIQLDLNIHYTVRSSTEHRDDHCDTVLRWTRREHIPQCSRRHDRRHLDEGEIVYTYDAVQWISVPWANAWAHHWRLH